MPRLYGCEKLIVGRGATGVYAVLYENRDRLPGRMNVILPANSSYALGYPVVLAGYNPVFVDVNPLSGNVDEKTVTKAASDNNAGCVIVPHMYGNPVTDIMAIASYCKANDILLIEDCSVAPGAYVAEDSMCVQCGSFGDYAVYSLGYGKTIDIGSGGFVIQNTSDYADLSVIAKAYDSYPAKNAQVDDWEKFFLKLYKLVRHYGENHISASVWASFMNERASVLRDMLVFKDDSCDNKAEEALKSFDEIIDTKREKAKVYQTFLQKCKQIKMYPFEEGSVPWRFSFFASEEVRDDLTDYLQKNYIKASNWCSVVTPLFGIAADNYPNAYNMQKTIINLPLDVEDDEIIRYCWLINNYFED